jgi:filamentous hemagglutinin
VQNASAAWALLSGTYWQDQGQKFDDMMYFVTNDWMQIFGAPSKDSIFQHAIDIEQGDGAAVNQWMGIQAFNAAFVVGTMGYGAVARTARVVGDLGILDDAVFAQISAKATTKFSEDGQRIYSAIAGKPIVTVQDLTDALNQGVIKPSQLPINYVVIDGEKVIANTRTTSALENAGIPKDQWYGVNKTGQVAYSDPITGKPVTFDDLVNNQLNKNYGGSVTNARR